MNDADLLKCQSDLSELKEAVLETNKLLRDLMAIVMGGELALSIFRDYFPNTYQNLDHEPKPKYRPLKRFEQPEI
jgi:hypothetical protein